MAVWDLNSNLDVKKKLFDLEVITVRDTPPYGHAPTYQISLTYLERQKCYGLEIGQLYWVCGCMTIRWSVEYRNDLRGTLTFDLKVK
jgi:hypothetical protein